MEQRNIKEEQVIDLFRDTSVRYLGYANEVGEAFRSIIGARWVNVTYGVSTIYVLADTSHKSVESYKHNKNEPNHLKRVAYTTADTLIWQFLASVAFPGLTINRLCAFASYALKKSDKLPKTRQKWAVTAIGLLAIPLIIKPIDRFTDLLLDESIRKYRPA